MSDTTGALRRRLTGAGDLRGVVRTMKSLAAMNIGQYEQAVAALAHYAETVELGLSVSLATSPFGRGPDPMRSPSAPAAPSPTVDAVVFGSDQGLVGRFNESVADFAVQTLTAHPAGLAGARVWAVGERVRARLEEAGLRTVETVAVPVSVAAITPLVGRLLVASQAGDDEEGAAGTAATERELLLFHHRPDAGEQHAPEVRRLLPLDAAWRNRRTQTPWPGEQIPELMPAAISTLRAFIREYLFVSIFQACAESLATENASRLAAMQRAERNIDELMDEMELTMHRVRQAGIDAELFDLVAGFEALKDTH